MATMERPYQPPLFHRVASAINIGAVGFLCRTFLYGLNRTQTQGLDRFLAILDSRRDEGDRTRGLITVSNHTSVLDDPIMWGVLPYRYAWNPSNMRWSLGSYDICFKNGTLSAFFAHGNTLPTHRAHHSPYGGLFQPTMTQAIRLLSDPHPLQSLSVIENNTTETPTSLSHHFPPSDPFSTSELTYSTTGADRHPAPAAYPSRRFSWVHIFPEGMIHQHPDKVMRYFKWGVARLILESEPCPDLVAIWIDGLQDVMDDQRGSPRALPRAGKNLSVSFGDLVDTETVFGPFRQRWTELQQKARTRRARQGAGSDGGDELGVVSDDELRTGAEAENLRIEVTLAVRNQVLKVRQMTGLPDEDPKRGLAETWRIEGSKTRTGEKADGSVVREM